MKAPKCTVLSITLVLAGMWWLGSGVYIHCKAWLAQQLIASAWQRTLAGGREVRPWPWADTWPIARLRTADANIDVYVLADASGRSLAFGPGQVSGTATIGDLGDTLIAGHRDTHFKFLRTLPIGAELILQTEDGNEHRYRIVDEVIFDTRNERLASSPGVSMPGVSMPGVSTPGVSTPGVSTLTLLTCYPFDTVIPGGPLRYAAIAKLL